MNERFILTTDVDRAERKRGIVAEIIDLQHPSDGGPVAIAQCFDKEDAERILRALKLPGKF